MVFYRTDKIVTDMSLSMFLESFSSSFPKYVEHLVIGWYLRNAKAEGFSERCMPNHMMWMISDFAQNIQVVKRYETAEEYYKRPEVALHGTVSGMISVQDGKLHEISHVASSDYRCF